jgi:hypothetical protein
MVGFLTALIKMAGGDGAARVYALILLAKAKMQERHP